MTEGIKTKPLMSKDALLRRIGEAYEELQRVVNALDENSISQSIGGGEWTVKDLLAHLASWEDILVRFHIGGLAFDEVIGMEGAVYRHTPYDEINEHLFMRHQGLTFEAAMGYWTEIHSRLLGELDVFPEDQLHQPHPQLSSGKAAGLNWIDYIVANTYEHYEEHLASLLKS